MFGKKKCNGCGEKLSEKHSFCPYCGSPKRGKKSQVNEGMLGNDDFVNGIENLPNSMFGGVGGRVMGKMFENAMKILEKEMEKEIKRSGKKENYMPKTNFQLFINGKKIDSFENQHKKHKVEKKEFKKLPQNILKKFSQLPQKNPKTDVRRLSDKVIYEINMPGVKSLKDISIIKLEDNIEVRAISKDKAYQKMIPVDYPLTDYDLEKGKLILEFDSEE